MSGDRALGGFETIEIGDTARLRRRFSADAIDGFAQISGDTNPLHVDTAFAANTRFGRRVAHGMLSAAYVSSIIGTQLPGPGALWFQQEFEFLVPVLLDDEVEFVVRVEHKSEATRTVLLSVHATNQRGVLVLKGRGRVMVPEDVKNSQENKAVPSLALVTGASRGIGRAIALALGRLGHRVVVNYRERRECAEEVVAAIQRSGGVGLAVGADVNDADAVQRMVAEAEGAFGESIYILVNNASGPMVQKAFLDHAWDDLQQHLGTQVGGALNCIRAVAPPMIEKGGGRIVNIGSTSSWGAPPANLTGYVVAKAALAALTRTAAVELGPKGIRVNMVSPGMTDTDMVADVPERLRKVLAMQTPLRRLASPNDVAATVVMLASDAGEFVHGADIPVCGGSVM